MSFIRECNSGEDKEKVNEFVRRAKEIMKAEVTLYIRMMKSLFLQWILKVNLGLLSCLHKVFFCRLKNM